MMNHQGTVKLESSRLVLRRFTLEDAPAAFQNWMSDEQVTPFLRWPAHRTLCETQEVLTRWAESYCQPDFYQWAIVPKQLGCPIGSISAVKLDEQTRMVHIGYCIGSRWWHQGYTSEALERIIPFFFEQVGAQRIESQHDPENPHSGAVMKKCGFRYEGTLRRADWSNRGIVDACVYGLLASDWPHNAPDCSQKAPHPQGLSQST